MSSPSPAVPLDDDAGGIPGPTTHPLASALGMGAWGLRMAPEVATGLARLLLNPARLYRRARGQSRTARTLGDALSEVVTGPKGITAPSVATVGRLVLDSGRYRVARGVAYGPARGQVLDVWRSPDLDPATSSAPVLVYVPGGGWVFGSTALQGTALLGHLAAHGWVCVSVGYRASPQHRWPTHLHDVKRALGWVHGTIAEHGGDPEQIAIAGASAGGHLAALAALTPGDTSLQPGFEGDRTDVTAVVGLYGRYDWESRDTLERQRFMAFLERIVVGATQAEAAHLFAAASPIALAGDHAPPFLVVHGRSDAVIPVHQAREFVARLREVSAAPVAYAELPGTGHAFDLIDPFRAAHLARAVELFLRTVQVDSARPPAEQTA
ncbi:MAG: alpha/beta hydrolase [Acidimicrobiales bacterium]